MAMSDDQVDWDAIVARDKADLVAEKVKFEAYLAGLSPEQQVHVRDQVEAAISEVRSMFDRSNND